ncbi:MAG: uroporphyrinogen decarboxylase [Candidatus Wallbacteria bacterium HGW-Wallbacteria-1]|jgi:uroporphyrinogen decarboxylase|uniref:Uroporphyrinogen decarboxylase n=1 Tax=Candidatus Wallbacteria bacterium HGW-Wallbacteria-1 TaxID=2013854 RepID=A0A2N1PKK9_9BACT|nr:MAG: uroporphyrinogen decarboxylase [Candidatus Wallbacteria bacterium HGW-Wallbacteria-1]
MTTGIERLAAAARGEIADRIPVFCNLFDQGARELGIPTIQEYYSRGDLVAEAQLKMREKYGYDNVWNLFYVGKEAEILGCRKMIYSQHGPPNVGEFIIRSHEDVHRLQIPADLSGHPQFTQCAECMKILVSEVGGRQPITAYLTASMTLPSILMGMDKWIELLFTGPAEVRDELLTKCSDFFRTHMTWQMEAGADCLVYANPFASTTILPMKMVSDLVFKWMERDLAGFDRNRIVFYCGGAPFNNIIQQVIERLGVFNFYLSPMADISEGRRIVNGRGLTCGVFDDMKLLRFSRDEIRTEVKRILHEGMPGNRFAFGVQGMPLGITEENIRYMLEAAFEFGAASSEIQP